ncbi:unnamed protein product [Allacma fusca]|uniref:Nucleolar complex protein 2 homolog n=1 Tax=Allacma fusca TaxID=39272 RepID=A0A8J2KPJ0_9HEXA|nr:unnamed protein product [Allacma fusca]
MLNFEDSDDQGESDEEEEVHKPPEELEVASDSEAEEEQVQEESQEHKGIVESTLKKRIVNLHVIAEWESKLSRTKDLGVLINVIEAFESAVETVLKGKDATGQKWKVEGSTNFNALVRLCIRHLKGFCARFICASNNSATAENLFDTRPFEMKDKNKSRWQKLRPKIGSYMTALIAFLKSMGNADAIASVLRHCQKMSGFWALMGSKSFKLSRVLINIWAQGEDSCRVLAFLTLIRMANYSKEIYLERFMKQMYISYVANSKFTSVNSWPSINFMRNCLVEIYILDTSTAYTIAFPFIRQLAIHLRNAVTAGTGSGAQANQTKTEASRIVYSWQFVHSVHLWVDLLAQAAALGDGNLKLLIYPVVQVCLGTIKLVPSKKFVPLRFHIVRMLIKLQEKTRTFIPVLPTIMEALQQTDFSSKSVSKFSVRPLDFTCCLKADSSESGFLKSIAENTFECILSACAAVATELAFPEVVCPTVMQLKSFLKKHCRNAEVSKKYKTLIDKIEENSNFIKAFRDKALENGQISLSDQKTQQILRVQIETASSPPPLLKFAEGYLKLNRRADEKLRKKSKETKEERLVPRMNALQSKPKRTQNKEDSEGPLFAGSDDDDDDYETKLEENIMEVKPKNPKEMKKRKKIESADDDEEEEVPAKKSKKKLKSLKKKKAKKFTADLDTNVEDELVDLDLSD